MREQHTLPLFAEQAPQQAQVTMVCDDVLAWAEKTPPIGAHAMLCDPPYSLGDGKKGFMSKAWDNDIAFRPETWKALAQHLLPGAFGMCFASSRGWHRLACAIEDAGLIIHPSIFGWGFAQGFPKASRIDTKIDSRSGTGERELREFCAYVRAARDTKGLKNKDIDQALGLNSNGGTAAHYTCTDGEQPRYPRLALYPQLKELLRLGDRFDSAIEGAEREVIGPSHRHGGGTLSGVAWNIPAETPDLTAPATPLAQTWAGHRYGLQALKPALEPIIVFQVPYGKTKPVQSITQTGAGALNIDGGRIGMDVIQTRRSYNRGSQGGEEGWKRPWNQTGREWEVKSQSTGRWPPNFAICHTDQCVRVGERQVKGAGWSDTDQRTKADGYRWASDGREEGQHHYTDANGNETVTAWQCAPGCVVVKLDAQAGEREARGGHAKVRTGSHGVIYSPYHGGQEKVVRNDTGGASRFFMTADFSLDIAERLAQADPVRYVPKASRGERDAGLEGMAAIHRSNGNKWTDQDYRVARGERSQGRESGPRRNTHPCCKPLKLCQWLATLLLPPAAYAPRRLLIPFCGTGSEAIGAMLAGWDEIVMIDSEQSYVDIARQRVAYWQQRGTI
jgi:hypothetical protein